MNSQLRFVMHPDDEKALVDVLLQETSVVLIDGPRWKTARPETTRSLASGSTATAAGVERRYKALRKLVKATYLNSLVRWQNPTLPFLPAGPSRSANPSNLDTSLWVGPAAMAWLRADGSRRIKMVATSPVEGVLGA